MMSETSRYKTHNIKDEFKGLLPEEKQQYEDDVQQQIRDLRATREREAI